MFVCLIKTWWTSKSQWRVQSIYLRKSYMGHKVQNYNNVKRNYVFNQASTKTKCRLAPSWFPSSRDGSARLLSMVPFSLPNKRLLPSLGSSPRCFPLAGYQCCSLAHPSLLRTLLVSWPCYGQTYHCFLYAELRLRARHGHNVRQAPYITHCWA
jgi:hypothetical protein